MLEALLAVAVLLGQVSGGGVYLEGAALEEAGRYGEALACFEACAGLAMPAVRAVAGEEEGGVPAVELRLWEEPLALWARVRAARCRVKGGDVAGGRAALEAIIAAHADHAAAAMARAVLLEQLRVSGDRRGAAAQADAVFAWVGHAPQSGGASPLPWWMDGMRWRYAEDLAQSGRASEAFGVYRRIVETTDLIRARQDAARLLLRSEEAGDRAAAILGLYRADAQKEAGQAVLKSVGMFLGADGGTQSVDVLLGLLGAAADAADVGAAVDAAVSGRADEAWLRVWLIHAARVQLAAGRAARAQRLAELLAGRFPEERDGADLLWGIAKYYEGLKEDAKAAGAYRAIVTWSPKSFRAPNALWAMGWKAHARGEKAAAEALFAELAERYPESRYRTQAQFLLGRWRDAAGDEAGAERWYRAAMAGGLGQYYAHRAAERLADRGLLPAGPNLRVDGSQRLLQTMAVPGRYVAVPEGVSSRPELALLRFFGREGLEEGEWLAVEVLRGADGGEVSAVYQAVAEAGLAHTAWQFLWSGGRGVSAEVRAYLDYPRAYWEEVAALGRETGVDPYLILSVARQESTFRAGVVSSAGAMGVMQLMPATAKWLGGREAAVGAATASRRGHPPSSIRMGAYYLKMMIERSGGNLIYALASYNAGPGNCDKWRAKQGNLGPDEFIEAIPLEETRGYVKKVLGNYAAYRSLYGECGELLGR